MGHKKQGLLEGLGKGQEIGKEAIDQGEQLEQDGSEIRQILDSIDTSMDEDDMVAVKSAESGYDRDFHGAFDQEVESRAADVENLEGDVIDQSRENLDKVNDAADRFQEITGITDLGAEHAVEASDSMHRSAEDYQNCIDSAQVVCDEVRDQVNSLRSAMDSMFG